MQGQKRLTVNGAQAVQQKPFTVLLDNLVKKQQKLVRKQHRQKKISMTKGLTDEEETLAMMTPHQYEE